MNGDPIKEPASPPTIDNVGPDRTVQLTNLTSCNRGIWPLRPTSGGELTKFPPAATNSPSIMQGARSVLQGARGNVSKTRNNASKTPCSNHEIRITAYKTRSRPSLREEPNRFYCRQQKSVVTNEFGRRTCRHPELLKKRSVSRRVILDKMV